MKTIAVVIEYDPDTKTYGATSPDLPDIYAVSESRDDVLDRFAYSVNEYLTYLRENNEPSPSFATRHEVVTIAIPAAESDTGRYDSICLIQPCWSMRLKPMTPLESKHTSIIAFVKSVSAILSSSNLMDARLPRSSVASSSSCTVLPWR